MKSHAFKITTRGIMSPLDSCKRAGLFLAVALACAVPTSAAVHVSAPILAALDAADDAAAHARVIVNFQTHDGKRWGVDADAVTAAREAVLDVLEGLPEGAVRNLVPYRRIPALAVDIRRDALDVLQAHPLVYAINQNAPIQAQLSQAHAITGVPQVHTLGYRGDGVKVLVVDSGVLLNIPGFSAPGEKLIGHGCFRADNNCISGGSDADTELQFSHGTHVAGIIAGPNGVAPDARFHAAKILDKELMPAFGANTIGDIVRALDFAIDDPEGIDFDLVNMSLSTFQSFTSRGACDAANAAIVSAVATLNANGVAVFASAGNGGQLDRVSAPACVSGVIGVGSSGDASTQEWCGDTGYDPNLTPDRVSCLSQAHPEIGDQRMLDLYAPGCSITSIGAMPGGGTFETCGTSMASPYAAGVAALVIEAARDLGVSLTPAQLEQLLRDTGTLLPDYRDATLPAVPRVDAAAAIAALAGAPSDEVIFDNGFEAGAMQ